MKKRHPGFKAPADYRIEVQGKPATTAPGQFDGMSVTVVHIQGRPAVTTLCGQVADQAALYAILARIEEMGLSLRLVEWENET